MADTIYNGFFEYLASGVIDLVNHEIKCALFKSSYTPNKDAHDNWGDLSNECSGTGYTSGGQALTGKSVTHDDVADEGIFSSSNPLWTGVNLLANPARYVILYKNAVAAADRKLIACFDLGEDKAPENVNFEVQWDAAGILKWKKAA